MDVWAVEQNEAPNPASLTSMNAMIDELKALRVSKEEFEESAKELSKEISKLESKLIEHLKENGMTSFKGASGQIVLSKRKNVSQPATPEDREAFFNYLKEQEIFDKMISVNARTLSSWAVKEIEAKQEQGVFGWVPPGLKEPSEHDILSLRKA